MSVVNRNPKTDWLPSSVATGALLLVGARSRAKPEEQHLMTDAPVEPDNPFGEPWSPGYDDDRFDPLTKPLRRSEKPSRNADHPIAPLLTIELPEVLELLELQALATKPRERDAMRMIIANLMRPQVLRDEHWIFYSRDNNHYSSPFVSFYYPSHYTRTFIIRVIDRLEGAGLIENDAAWVGKGSWFRSRLRPAPDFAARLFNLLSDVSPPGTF